MRSSNGILVAGGADCSSPSTLPPPSKRSVEELLAEGAVPLRDLPNANSSPMGGGGSC
jgi:hypothetical protein